MKNNSRSVVLLSYINVVYAFVVLSSVALLFGSGLTAYSLLLVAYGMLWVRAYVVDRKRMPVKISVLGGYDYHVGELIVCVQAFVNHHRHPELFNCPDLDDAKETWNRANDFSLDVRRGKFNAMSVETWVG